MSTYSGPDSIRTVDQRPDLMKAKDAIVVANYMRDPSYAPYCLRCARLVRMTIVEPFLWRHDCGAVHDERQVLT